MKILIVKLSSLGDVVHTLPAVMDIQTAFPQAQIDWVVERSFAPLVQRCAAVHRVIACDLRQWRKRPFSAETHQAWRAFKADLQREAYDAVIDLQGLTKSAWMSWLARTTSQGKRFAMANRTMGSGYEPPTRWVADVAIAVEPHIHALVRSRVVCAQALGYSFGAEVRYGLVAQDRPPSSIPTQKPCVVLVHGTSRADKEWPLQSWLTLGKRLNDLGYQVVLPHGNAQELQRSQEIAASLRNAVVWPSLSLDELTHQMSSCQGVIGVDSGLSHIAVALDLPHVQIYNFDTAWRTGPMGLTRQVFVFHPSAPTLETVWQAWQKVSA